MSTAATFARSIARRTVARTLRTQVVAPQFGGSLRFASTYYTPAHEYITVEGSVGTVGVTDFAQAALGDIVFVDLPELDDEFEKGDSFGSVESVKAASDVYAPVTGSVTEINEALNDEPAMVNTGAEDDGWFIKMSISDESELESLMDEAAYKEHCEKESS
mmetsp:Transcript_44208/g.106522  ORF Transcript_44208/g.106522 Transcript_44208/m.106522 type:complete len:161 (+) Transcript_44208:86-568(+)|eukprot:CAMPEP_0113623790 /NCGR_PEP_ID=MMETSP0017_2-20120614/12248_1 /TAXON_ID=2856 /ORGANISM="Cylindrotheca closterium" /LENGTH=160 /DNA_ID=CAMNT_0000533769 /DNA_START=90 /DNA_END=572 /DNA_ORIENTATION=- /assembly_acc=CAM_ASM_000147